MMEQSSDFEIKFARGHMALVAETILEILNILHGIRSPNKGKIRKITNALTKIAMIIYADEVAYIQAQQDIEQPIAQRKKTEEPAPTVH